MNNINFVLSLIVLFLILYYINTKFLIEKFKNRIK